MNSSPYLWRFRPSSHHTMNTVRHNSIVLYYILYQYTVCQEVTKISEKARHGVHIIHIIWKHNETYQPWKLSFFIHIRSERRGCCGIFKLLCKPRIFQAKWLMHYWPYLNLPYVNGEGGEGYFSPTPTGNQWWSDMRYYVAINKLFIDIFRAHMKKLNENL